MNRIFQKKAKHNRMITSLYNVGIGVAMGEVRANSPGEF